MSLIGDRLPAGDVANGLNEILRRKLRGRVVATSENCRSAESRFTDRAKDSWVASLAAMSLMTACSPAEPPIGGSNESWEEVERRTCGELYAPNGSGSCSYVNLERGECSALIGGIEDRIGQRIAGWEKFSSGLIVQFQDGMKMPLWSRRIDCIDPPFDPLTSAEQTRQTDSGGVSPTSVEPEPVYSPLEVPPSQADEPWLLALKERQDAIGCGPDVVTRRTRSLDGNFEYLEVCNTVRSNGILQRRLADGRLKEVADGSNVKVIRNGPWRGFLLVDQLIYRPEGGSFYPTTIVRPDGKEMKQVPGTGGDDNGEVLAAWLKQNGWTAN